MPSTSPFVVRLPGASAATAASPPHSPKTPSQSFVMDPNSFPSVGREGPVPPKRTEGRPGAWATRPILPIAASDDHSGLALSGPVERANAQSPVSPSPPPAHHIVPPSPSPSDQAAHELAEDLKMMDVGGDSPPGPIARPVPLRAEAEPYGTVDANVLEQLAYYRGAAEYWQGMCAQMQAHVAMVCGPLPPPPPPL